jgi:glycosyltransferase involved in cell wall biosynthesis
MNLQRFVEFTGYVSDAELTEVYQSAALYAISSRVELQSISTLEAMASGLPVVAVDGGALPELVATGLNGTLVPAGDAQAFGRAIAEIILDPDRRNAMGRTSRLVAEGHSMTKMVGQYEDLFDRVRLESREGSLYGARSA